MASLIAFYELAFDDVYAAAVRLTHGQQHEAEDLVHDAFVRLVRTTRAGDVTAVGVGWMVTVVRRLYIDRWRSRDREQRRLRLVANDSVAQPPIPDGLRRPTSILGGLNERERTALILRYVEDLPVGEVAELLGSTVRATESLLQRAKHKARTTTTRTA
ncbi:MAG: RNA polymerase sigma factor [Ilumatobacteraceae bacterium]